MMSLVNLMILAALLLFTQQVICYVPQQRSALTFPNIPPRGDLPLDLHDSLADDSGRVVYDPGDVNDPDVNNEIEVLRQVENDMREEEEIANKATVLMKLLQDPTIGTLPLLYVEETEPTGGLEDLFSEMAVDKRSRYNRRYPLKRQTRYRYNADARYLCVPSREDVFKLLIGIQDSRNEAHQKTVKFCNRKRPAKSILRNIRVFG